ncbi:hypothetical protein F4859DRAFT_525806 [Xylaria cf. heliscus]|nr:hypothetical protein F4859DRAFT_525806 [Xylaria cf. heliscus]
MTASQDKQAKAVKEGKKTAKKVTEKKIRKSPNPNQKRGQPTAAARLISSPYIKFGWHKPLGGDVKQTVQQISSMADAMYMLQINREQPIDSLSLRNGIFWEHRQLQDESIISTPALDHIDLFPIDDEAFQDTLRKIAKQPSDDNGSFLLHYLFGGMRSREFLLLPVEISGDWVTIISRMRRLEPQPGSNLQVDFDREITDLAIIDPQPNDRDSRRKLITGRLPDILAEGLIKLSTETTVRDIIVPDLASGPTSWQTGLVAHAISHELFRRLKTLQFRRSRADGVTDENFLWAAFEEQYNFDTYRQNLMSACAHQTIETSSYQVRLALEVPSDDSNYQPDLLRHGQNEGVHDEKWEVFQSPTHTVIVDMSTGLDKHLHSSPGVDSGACNLEDETNSVMGEPESSSPPDFSSPSYTSTPVFAPTSPPCSPTSPSPSYSSISLLPYHPQSPSYSSTSPEVRHAPSPPVLSPSYIPSSPDFSPTNPLTTSPACDGDECMENGDNGSKSKQTVEESGLSPNNALEEISDENQLPVSADTGYQLVPIAPMGPHEFIPGLTFVGSPEIKLEPFPEDQSALQAWARTPVGSLSPLPTAPFQEYAQGASRKRPLSIDGDDEEPPYKRVKVKVEEDE